MTEDEVRNSGACKRCRVRYLHNQSKSLRTLGTEEAGEKLARSPCDVGRERRAAVVGETGAESLWDIGVCAGALSWDFLPN